MTEKPIETILCIEAERVRDLPRGLTPVSAEGVARITTARNLWLIPRPHAETDERFRQLIPYIVLTYKDQVGIYTRSKTGGDARIHDQVSLGFGGHVRVSDVLFRSDTYEGEGEAPAADEIDGPETLRWAALRELEEELQSRCTLAPETLGLIIDDANPIGRVHIGVVLRAELHQPTVVPNEAALIDCRLIPKRDLGAYLERLEPWSQLVAQRLLGQIAADDLTREAQEMGGYV